MTFEPRTIDCPDCFEGRYEIASGPGYVSCECETCEGSGEVDASCAECSVIRALNEDGVCTSCFLASLTPAELAQLAIAQMGGKLCEPLRKRSAA